MIHLKGVKTLLYRPCKELKLKFKELEQWIQKYVTSIN